MNISTQFPRLVLPASIVTESVRLLRRWRKRETVIYWVGEAHPDVAVVTSVVRPRQHNTPGSFHVSSEANADIVVWLCAHQLKLLAQLHTHPGSYVGHSDGDDLGASLAFLGFYSIVVPHYGRSGILPLKQCGVHVFQNSFLELPPPIADKQIQIVPHVADFLA
jgi:hypothetical protein